MALSKVEQLAALDEAIEIQQSRMASYGMFQWDAYKKTSDEVDKMRVERAALILAIGEEMGPSPAPAGTGVSKYVWWAVGGLAVLGIVAYLLRKKS